MSMETIFYWTGVLTLCWLAWWFAIRHISYGLSEAISASLHLASLDFSCTDTNKLNVEVAKHFSNWDKLWLVPRHFRNVFLRETIDHWKYY